MLAGVTALPLFVLSELIHVGLIVRGDFAGGASVRSCLASCASGLAHLCHLKVPSVDMPVLKNVEQAWLAQ